jgi:hypothetical protein
MIMNKNNEFAAESANSARSTNSEQDSNSNTTQNREETKRTFGAATMWAIRRSGRVFRIHSRLSRI